MATREDMGSWLGGGPAGGDTGARDGLGLPSSGPGALAGPGRRVVALAVDWALSLVISGAFLAGDPLATLAVFAVANVVLVGTAGCTVGHRLLGLQVRTHAPAPAGAARPGGPARGGRDGVVGTPADPAPPGPSRAVVRTALLCLVVPAVVRDSAGRSLHDRAAGTVIVRR